MLIEKLSAISLDLTAAMEQELPDELLEDSLDDMSVKGRTKNDHTAKGGAKDRDKFNTAMKQEDFDRVDDPVKEEFDTPSTTSR